MNKFDHYVSLSRWRAEQHPDKCAYVYLDHLGAETEWITYADIDRKARSLAVELMAHKAQNERVLILLPSDTSYIIAFFGCLYAGATAVTLTVPNTREQFNRILKSAEESGAKFVLTTSGTYDFIHKFFQGQMGKTLELPDSWFKIDTLLADKSTDWNMPPIEEETIAYLQFSSGSTAAPKGVVITHKNLMQQGEYLKQWCGVEDEDVVVSWLPPFHDMGLIFGLLQSFYSGTTCYYMNPLTFIRKPIRWLEALSRYRGTATAAPNFAYDLCCETFKAEEAAGLDLSNWTAAINGSEPVRHKTMERFSRLFAPYGFKSNAFSPSYGMAEAILGVTSGERLRGPVCRKVDLEKFEQNEVCFVNEGAEKSLDVVSCGKPKMDMIVKIVDPSTLIPKSVNQVGEIMIKGRTIAKGYWNNELATKETFNVMLSTGEGPFLRTGDLGFLDENHELYITGRCKDLIIIRGKNHAPPAIEESVSESAKEIRNNYVAAFSTEIDGEERLIIVAEIIPEFRKDLNSDLIANTIFGRIAKDHGVSVYEIVFIEGGKFPKTSSGKVERQTCKNLYLSNQFAVISKHRNKLYS